MDFTSGGMERFHQYQWHVALRCPETRLVGKSDKKWMVHDGSINISLNRKTRMELSLSGAFFEDARVDLLGG